jgi:hypothetical protein
VWCVTTRNYYSWAGWTGFVVQSFLRVPKLPQSLYEQKDLMVHHLGVCLVRKPFTHCYRARKSYPGCPTMDHHGMFKGTYLWTIRFSCSMLFLLLGRTHMKWIWVLTLASWSTKIAGILWLWTYSRR